MLPSSAPDIFTHLYLLDVSPLNREQIPAHFESVSQRRMTAPPEYMEDDGDGDDSACLPQSFVRGNQGPRLHEDITTAEKASSDHWLDFGYAEATGLQFGDIHNDGRLTRDGFTIAWYLVQTKRNGVPIPTSGCRNDAAAETAHAPGTI
ncbi:hypothetical protein B0H10DRAFT_2210253 [Mycena sp. CBHHK59/15]|nr:hypothetical protein B0H10DRAFT_2210253 [Mycena sp. CBHHK59/15]